MSETTIVVIVASGIGVLLSVIGALILLGINKTLKEIQAIWEEIKEIKEKQAELRADLPQEYLRLYGPGYAALHDGIQEIKDTFSRFADDCRKGRCGGPTRNMRRLNHDEED